VRALRVKMENERYHSGPETRMEPFDPSWDLCRFTNVDDYRRGGFRGPGRRVPEIALEAMSEEMDHWNQSILAAATNPW